MNPGFLNEKRGAGGHKLATPSLQLTDSPLSPSTSQHHKPRFSPGTMQATSCLPPPRLLGSAMPCPTSLAPRYTSHKTSFFFDIRKFFACSGGGMPRCVEVGEVSVQWMRRHCLVRNESQFWYLWDSISTFLPATYVYGGLEWNSTPSNCQASPPEKKCLRATIRHSNTNLIRRHESAFLFLIRVAKHQ